MLRKVNLAKSRIQMVTELAFMSVAVEVFSMLLSTLSAVYL